MDKELIESGAILGGYRIIKTEQEALKIFEKGTNDLQMLNIVINTLISYIQIIESPLNKIGVNLNQIAKKINIHDVYQFTSDDRAVFKQVLQELKNCFSVLQKYFEMIDQNR